MKALKPEYSCVQIPGDPLNEQAIRARLTPAGEALLAAISLHQSLPSTNQYLQEHASESGVVCLAEAQTAGRGRNGRRWVSPPGQNIYLSVHWLFSEAPPGMQQLGLAAGIAVARALRRSGYPDVGLKWPNDLYLRGKKLGGLLVDSFGQAGQGLRVIVGTGVNVAMQTPDDAIDQPWISLLAVDANATAARNAIIAAILNELLPMLNQFAEHGPDYVRTHWPGLDLAKGKAVTVIDGGDKTTGIGAGIDREGRFLLRTADARLAFHQAEVSLRLA